MNTCVQCGNIVFRSWIVYAEHVKTMHNTVLGMSPHSIKHLTMKEKARIVYKVESGMKAFLIGNENGPIVLTHDTFCRCNDCFDKKCNELFSNIPDKWEN